MRSRSVFADAARLTVRVRVDAVSPSILVIVRAPPEHGNPHTGLS
jgi:hypothetical protein